MANKNKILNIVTPSVNPHYIPNLKKQIEYYKKLYPDIHIKWIICYDSKYHIKQFNENYIIEVNTYNKNSVKGNAQRNECFKYIEGGFIYLLDDDTTLVSTPFELISEGIDENVIHTFTCNIRGHNIGDNVILKTFGIDSGCFIFHKDMIKDQPYSYEKDIHKKCSDGRFIERIAKNLEQEHHYGYESFNWNVKK